MTAVAEVDVDLVREGRYNRVRKMCHGKKKRMGGKGEDGVVGVDQSLLPLPAAPSEFLGCAWTAWWRGETVDGGKRTRTGRGLNRHG